MDPRCCSAAAGITTTLKQSGREKEARETELENACARRCFAERGKKPSAQKIRDAVLRIIREEGVVGERDTHRVVRERESMGKNDINMHAV